MKDHMKPPPKPDTRLGASPLAQLLPRVAVEGGRYDPAVKLEQASTDNPALKRRSQFRIKYGNLSALYVSMTVINTVDEY
jgi:hypothetical protein